MSCSRSAVINISTGVASISENSSGGAYPYRASKVWFIYSTGPRLAIVPTSMRKMCGFTSSCACARSHQGLWSLLIQYIVSNDSGSGQRSPRSDCPSEPSLSAHTPKAHFCLMRLTRNLYPMHSPFPPPPRPYMYIVNIWVCRGLRY